MKHLPQTDGRRGDGDAVKQRLSEAIDDYGKHRVAMKKGENARRNDKATLTALLKYSGSNLFVENITDHHIDVTMTELAQTNSDRSLANHHYILANFFKWCAKTHRMPRYNDPMEDRAAPDFVVEERRRLHVTKFGPLKDAAGHPRDRMLFSSGLYLLSRSSEILNIRVEDLNFQDRRIRVKVMKTKGRKRIATDLMPITREMDTELRTWLSFYQSKCGALQPHWFLIPALSRPVFGQPINGGRPVYNTKSQVLRPENPYGPRAHRKAQAALEVVGFQTRNADGTTRNEGMHTLRRSGARARYDALLARGHSGALRQVQMLLHHAHGSMTEDYIGLTQDRLERDDDLMGEWMYPQVAPGQEGVLDLADYRVDPYVPVEWRSDALQVAAGL